VILLRTVIYTLSITKYIRHHQQKKKKKKKKKKTAHRLSETRNTTTKR